MTRNPVLADRASAMTATRPTMTPTAPDMLPTSPPPATSGGDGPTVAMLLSVLSFEAFFGRVMKLDRD
ncbi:MAG: hypothetical protein JWO31_2473, partial [Phycisphaerales bacterium]|nr:hypothetical protein [Phycisphaerales bacterium]